MKPGDQITSQTFSATNNLQADLNDYKGRWLILYFYPKDSTPGCTTEGQDFRDAYQQIQRLNAEVLGVSRDSLKSHENFKCKQQFPFELISDQEETLCQLFDVIKMKSMYGKQVRGIERSTFLIDPKGVLRHEWRKVNVKGHVAEVIQTLKDLQK
ncbi:peroxiredoxin [Legionella micdadei]|uniref:thioredoxin-dependent peroxiredoxin n=1 Tax=Legionella micdadei TaxID=451 RepID=A0A098GC47_LEGMI|nr:peroxiredoxin [Legionella micdadei]ARG96341.1 peroxiredoxin [Legionella micdadei]ARG99092.1 peroxiredoxin [Legionella micdadei]KTD29578.1 peroxiredoxin, AhpC/TSA family protein [Legionella micdadei]NSL18025.1 peroxiredoxin [Legionella micdadei]CEG59540.1 putative peroxiredoxin ygaF [Legionella micdadei]